MKKRLIFLFMTLLIMVIPLISCGGGGGGGSSSGETINNPAEGNIVKGYVKIAAIPPATPTPIAGANVSINGKTTTANSSGYYKITNIAKGTWTLTVSATGYATDTSSWVFVGPTTVHEVNKYLQKL